MSGSKGRSQHHCAGIGALGTATLAISDLLRVLLKSSAAKHGVAPKILATSDDIEKLAASDEADIPALRGWRRELFGNDALALKHGELGLVMNEGAITVRRF